MRDSAMAVDDAKAEVAATSEQPATSSYVAPRLTKVGNVRDLLAGQGGTIPETDPTAFDPQQSSPQGGGG